MKNLILEKRNCPAPGCPKHFRVMESSLQRYCSSFCRIAIEKDSSGSEAADEKMLRGSFDSSSSFEPFSYQGLVVSDPV